MNELQQTEKHIVSAYERIQKQRELIRRLGRHHRNAPLMASAQELLGLMQDICKQFRVRRKFIQHTIALGAKPTADRHDTSS